jgi:hypothetical protein
MLDGLVRLLKQSLTLVKLIVLGLIYIILFAPFANRPDDTVMHILGTATQHLVRGGS